MCQNAAGTAFEYSKRNNVYVEVRSSIFWFSGDFCRERLCISEIHVTNTSDGSSEMWACIGRLPSYGQTDDLGARLEVAKRAAFCHPATLIAHPARLNRFCSDSAQLCLPCSPLIFPCYRQIISLLTFLGNFPVNHCKHAAYQAHSCK